MQKQTKMQKQTEYSTHPDYIDGVGVIFASYFAKGRLSTSLRGLVTDCLSPMGRGLVTDCLSPMGRGLVISSDANIPPSFHFIKCERNEQVNKKKIKCRPHESPCPPESGECHTHHTPEK